MTSNQKENAQYLWSFLLSLGFKADAVGSKRHVVLGETMFDKPNKDAFYIVIHFLLEKLNPSRMHEEFRHCYPVVDRKQDAEFRKLTLARLQEISTETGGSFPKVLASHLLSPSGPKFIHIMLSLAKHVMLQEIKDFHTDGSWVPKAIAMPASSLDMAEKRFQVARSSHLAAVVARDRLNHERQLRVKSWEKSVRNLMTEKAKYEDLLESQQGSAEQDGGLLQEKVQQARSLWAEVEKVLSSLREKQRIMDRVLQGDVDQYALDGADMKLRVPPVLQERMEKMAEQTSRVSQCDSSQPSLLHMLELLNGALAILNEERLRALGPTAELHAEAHSEGSMVEMDREALRQHMTRIAQAQEDLKKLRTRMSTEDIPQTRSAVRNAEANWDRKWAELLKNSILSSVMSADPGVDVLPAMAALSFEPAPEERLRSDVLFRPPPACAEPEQEIPQRYQTAVVEMVTKPSEETHRFRHIPTSVEKSSDEEPECVPEETPMLPCVVASPRPVTPVQPAPELPPQKSPPLPVLKDKKTRPPNTQTKKSAVKKKADILNLEFENLAEQFAQAVTTTPKDGSEGGIGLEHLLSSMIEPLSARRQIPRTPESLIADVRTSWRKAVEDSVTQKVCPSGKFPDSFTGLFTPYLDSSRTNVNHDVSSLYAIDAPVSTTIPLNTPAGSFTHSNTMASMPRSPNCNQQGAAVPFAMSFDSSHVESLTSRSANEGVEFSIANETIPELSSGDSLLSNNDSFLSNCSQDPSQEEVRVEDRPEEEEEELVLPKITSLLEGDKMSALLSARQRLQTILEKASFAGPKDQDLLSFSPVPAPAPAPGTPYQGNRGQETGDWEAPQQVFSLDLDQFESPSPPRQGDMHLPNLLTFSPVDKL